MDIKSNKFETALNIFGIIPGLGTISGIIRLCRAKYIYNHRNDALVKKTQDVAQSIFNQDAEAEITLKKQLRLGCLELIPIIGTVAGIASWFINRKSKPVSATSAPSPPVKEETPVQATPTPPPVKEDIPVQATPTPPPVQPKESIPTPPPLELYDYTLIPEKPIEHVAVTIPELDTSLNPDEFAYLIKSLISDFTMTNSKGGDTRKSLKLLINYIPKHPEFESDSTLKEIHKQLVQALYFAEKVAKSSGEDVHQIKEEMLSVIEQQTETLISGGWTASNMDGTTGGHDLKFVFHKTNGLFGELYSLEVINTGAGVEFHHHETEDNRSLVPRVLQLPPVTFNELKSSKFLDHLIRFQIASQNKDSTLGLEFDTASFDSREFYNVLFSLWPAMYNEIETSDVGTAQRGGTCFIKSLIHRTLLKIGASKSQQFKFWLKQELVKDYLATTTDQNLDIVWLEDSLPKIGRMIKKMHRNHLITDESFEKWVQLEQDARTRINNIKNNEDRQRKLESLPIGKPPVLETIENIECQPAKIGKEESEETPKFLVDSKLLKEELIKLRKTVNSIDSSEYSYNQKISYAMNILSRLPGINDQIWQSDFSVEERDNIILACQDISKLIFSNQVNKGGFITLSPHALYLLIKGVIITYQLLKASGNFPDNLLLQQLSWIKNLLPQPWQKYSILSSKAQLEIEEIDQFMQPILGKNINKDGTIHELSSERKRPLLFRSSFDNIENDPLEHFFTYDERILTYFKESDSETVIRYVKERGKKALQNLVGSFAENDKITPNEKKLLPFLSLIHQVLTFSAIRSESIHLRKTGYKYAYINSDFDACDFEYVRIALYGTDITTAEPPVHPEDKFFKMLRDKKLDNLTLNTTNEVMQPSFTEKIMREYGFAFLHDDLAIYETIAFLKHNASLFSEKEYQFLLNQLLFRDIVDKETGNSVKFIEHIFKSDPIAINKLYESIQDLYNDLQKTKHPALGYILQLHIQFLQLHQKYQPNTFKSALDNFVIVSNKLIEQSRGEPIFAKILGIWAANISTLFESWDAPLEVISTLLSVSFQDIIESSEFEKIDNKDKWDNLPRIDPLVIEYGKQNLLARLASLQETNPQKFAHVMQNTARLFNLPGNDYFLADGIIKIDNMTINLVEGIIYKDDNWNLLPERIVRNPLYFILFEEKKFFAESKRDGFSFYDQKGHNYLIVEEKDNIVIKRLINNHWYKFQIYEKLNFPGLDSNSNHPCSNGFFVAYCIHWKSEDSDEVLIENREQNRYVGLVTPNGVTLTDRNGNPKQLKLVDFKKGELIQELLTRLDSPSHILPFIEPNGDLKLIKLPRIGIDIKYSKKDATFSILQFPGYQISKHQKLKGLKGFTNYLIIENKQGQKKVLIPNRMLEDKEILPYVARKETVDLQKKPEQLFVFDLDDNIGIVPHDRTLENLYLFYLNLKTGDYREAYKIFKHLSFHSVKLVRKDLDLIYEIICDFSSKYYGKGTDMHPHAVALRLHLYCFSHNYWQALNASDYVIKENIETYFNQRNNVVPFELPPEYEALLQVEPSKQREICDFTPYLPDLKFNWLSDNVRDHMLKQLATGTPLEIINPLRPGAAFAKNFLLYYRIAKQGTPEAKNQLNKILRSCVYDPDPKIKLLVNILLGAMNKDNKLPSAEVMEKIFQDQNFAEEFRDKVTHKIPDIRTPPYPHRFKLLPPRRFTVKERILKKSSKQIAIKTSITSGTEEPKSCFSVLSKEAQKLFFTIKNPNKTEVGELDQLSRIFSTPKTPNPCIKYEYERIQRGIAGVQDSVLAEPDKILHLPKKKAEISVLKSEMKAGIDSSADQLRTLEKEILGLANNYHGVKEVIAEKLGEQRSPFTIPELLFIFGKKRDQDLLDQNPTLSAEEITALKKTILSYLLCATRKQQWERSLDLLNTYEKVLSTKASESELFNASHACLAALKAERSYNPIEYPQILVYEYFCDLKIRPDQWEVIRKFDNPEQAVNLLVEAYTGFGKSKVIIPIWLSLMAKEDKGCILVVPEALKGEIMAHLKKVMKGALNQGVVDIDFQRTPRIEGSGADRPEDNPNHELGRTQEKLSDARKKGKCVVMSDKTFHNIWELQPKETLVEWQNFPNDGGIRKNLFKRCLDLRFDTKAVVFFEESHITLNDKSEYNWSIGNRKPLAPWRSALSLEIYSRLIAHPITNELRVDFLPSTNKNTKVYSKDYYEKVMKPALIEDFIANLSVFKEFKFDRNLMKEYMNGQKGAQFEEYIQTLPKSIAENLVVIKDQLNLFLDQTLSQKCGENYGVADFKVDRTGIPWESSGGYSREGSQYSAIDSMINFTIQANLKEPFPIEYINNTLNNLIIKCERYPEEISKFNDLLKELNLKMDLNHLTEFQRVTFHHTLHDPKFAKARLQFICTYVLPEMRIYAEKIVSTPHLVANAFSEKHGASATMGIDNIPRDIKTHESPSSTIRNLLNLWKQNKTSNVQEIPFLSSEGFLSSLFEASPQKISEFSVLLDIGGYCRDFKNDTDTALLLLELTSKWQERPDAVGYFDRKGRPMIRPRGSKKAVALESYEGDRNSIFWYYSQHYITGIDLVLPSGARAIATISKDNQLTEAIQGSGRLRMLNAGQQCKFVTSTHDGSYMRQSLGVKSLSFADLMLYLMNTQGSRRGELQFNSLKLKWDAIVERKLWEAIKGLRDNPDLILSMFKYMRPLFVESTVENLLEREQTEENVPIDKALERLKTKYLKRLGEILSNARINMGAPFEISDIESEIDASINLSRLPDKVRLGMNPANSQISQTTSAQNQSVAFSQAAVSSKATSQTTSQTIAETYQMSFTIATSLNKVHSGRPKTALKRKPYSPVQSLPLTQELRSEKLQKFAKLFDGNLEVSPNIMHYAQEHNSNPSILYGEMKPTYYYQLNFDPQGRLIKVTLLDQDDAQDFLQMKTTIPNTQLWREDYGLIGKSNIPEKALMQDRTFLRSRVQTKALNGVTEFSKEEQQVLNDWLSTPEKQQLFKEWQELLQAS